MQPDGHPGWAKAITGKGNKEGDKFSLAGERGALIIG
jgi:hypothetical protein